MKIYNFFLFFILTFFGYSQNTVVDKEYNINSRKGQFFATWGWNRASYSTSDISFQGNDFNFTIYDVKADDKPKPFGINFLSPGDLTLPQTNYRLGYFIKDNYNVVIGADHMKYVMRQDQYVSMDGTISVGDYTYGDSGTLYNYDGTYTNQTVQLTDEFLRFEHTDGLNYIYVGANRFDNFNKLLHINTTNFEVNTEGGFDIGVLYPKTNTTILGNERYDEFHIAGYGLGVNVGLNLTFFKHFFLQTSFKVGYINMPDIRITKDTSEKAKQHFMFHQTTYSFGYRFRIN